MLYTSNISVRVHTHAFLLFFFYKGSNFCGVLFASLDKESLLKGSNHKGKNLLQVEQILSFKS